MEEHVIELNDLSKSYGSLKAVDKLNLSIRRGEVFGLLGPNGAGKSTTILMILGLTEPDSGRVRVLGLEPAQNPIGVKRKVGYLPDDVGFYDTRSGLNNLVLTAQLNRIPPDQARIRAAQLLERVGLADAADKRVGAYSRGMRQRLGLADVLIKEPEIIILDEPTLGIDPRGVREFLDLIARLSREEKITVLLSSHHLHQVQQVCDRVGIFVSGRLIAEGNIEELSARLFESEAYVIEAGIDLQGDTRGEAYHAQRIRALMEGVDGVRSVQYEKGFVRLGCASDLTPAISRTLVGDGYGLTHLKRQAYGLDEIYNRYFEGGQV